MKRFIFLVSVLSLPLFPAPVFAECAWVLWQQTITDHPAAPLDGVWTPRDSFTSNRPCASMAESMNNGKAGTASQGAGRGSKSFRSTTVFVCLPDTVDPRSPKGK